MRIQSTHAGAGLAALAVVIALLSWDALRPVEPPPPPSLSKPKGTSAAHSPPPWDARSITVGGVSGRVLLAGSRSPLRAVPVRISGGDQPVTVLTDAFGFFIAPVSARCNLSIGIDPPAPYLQRRVAGIVVQAGCTRSLGTIFVSRAQKHRTPRQSMWKGVLAGTVVTVDGVPIAGVKVRILYPSTESADETPGKNAQQVLDRTVSNGDGKFRISGLPIKDFDVQLTKEYYTPLVTQPSPDLVPDGSPTNEEFTLDGALSVSGVVLDSHEDPLPGVLVWPSDNIWIDIDPVIGQGTFELRSKLSPSTISRRDGSFTLFGLCPGLHTINAGKRGFACASEECVRAGTKGLRTELHRGRTISGVVEGPDGLPASGVRVIATPSSTTEPSFRTLMMREVIPRRLGNEWAVTSRTGHFSLVGLEDARYDLVAEVVPRGMTSTGHPDEDCDAWPRRADVSSMPPRATCRGVQAGASAVKLRLSRGCALLLSVVDESGAPIAGATVSLSAPLDPTTTYDLDLSANCPTKAVSVDPRLLELLFLVGVGPTNERGECPIEQLSSGSYEVWVRSTGFEDAQTTINVDEDAANARIVLKRVPPASGK